MTTITPEEYERAIKRAHETLAVSFIDPPDALIWKKRANELASALLHAHARRRTPGTVDIPFGEPKLVVSK